MKKIQGHPFLVQNLIVAFITLLLYLIPFAVFFCFSSLHLIIILLVCFSPAPSISSNQTVIDTISQAHSIDASLSFSINQLLRQFYNRKLAFLICRQFNLFTQWSVRMNELLKKNLMCLHLYVRCVSERDVEREG